MLAILKVDPYSVEGERRVLHEGVGEKRKALTPCVGAFSFLIDLFRKGVLGTGV